LIASLWDAGKWKVCCLASPPSTSMRFVAELSPWRLPWSRAPREPKQEPLLRPPVSRLSPDPELGRESDSRPQASRGVGGVNNRHSRNISSTVLLACCAAADLRSGLKGGSDSFHRDALRLPRITVSESPSS
jgi:hypothetical protein